jgi:hypothetical protein
MSEFKYCQGPKCHEHHTKDRIRGSKGDKHYETRKRSRFYYGKNFCSLGCQDEWFAKFGERAVDHFGRIHEPKRTDASSAWYKDYVWDRSHIGDGSRYNHFFINDLLGERRPITEQQYNDENLRTPSLVLDA